MNVIIVASVGRIDDTAMSMSVFRDDHLLHHIHEWNNDRCRLEFDIELPCRLKLQVSGKNQFDTRVDPAGNILADKFVKIEGLALDRIWVKKWMLESKIFDFHGEEGYITHSNYFGKNGYAEINIPYTDSLEFWLDILALDQ